MPSLNPESLSQLPSLDAFNIENIYLKLSILVAILTFAIYYASRNLEQGLIPGIEVISTEGTDDITYTKARRQFKKHARELMWRGVKTKCRGPFQVVTDTGPNVILPMRFIEEVKSDKRMSFDGFVEKDFFAHYPGFEGPTASVTSHVIQDTVRMKLTQSLNLVTDDLCEETDFALKEILGEPKEWKSIQLMRKVPDLVSRLSARVFLGKYFARDPTWLKISVRYTIAMMLAVRELRMWPHAVRPYIHWFLPTCFYLRRLSGQARKMMSNELTKRRAIRAENAENGIKNPKTADSLGWMIDITNDSHSFDYAGAQTGLTFAAIHTTSDLLTKAMYNLVTYPEYFELIRREMLDVLQEEGWKKTALYQMKLLDSFLKETQRLQGPSMISMTRVADEDIELSDGTVIPKDSPVKTFLDKHFDDSVYPEAERFDGYRFLKLRSQPGQENNWQFVTTSAEHAGFGHGMHACPGRFFASNEVKIAMCFMLLKYDWKLADEDRRPKMWDLGTEMIADMSVKLMYRRREEELDISSLGT